MKFAAACLSLLLACVPMVAHADENPYYLELGKEVNGEDAVRDWDTLSKKFPKELGKLQFLPESFIDDHTAVTRLQAGPIADKAKAEKICAALFRKNTPCFVIEGLERPTADQVAAAIHKGRAMNEAAAAPSMVAPASAPEPAPVAMTAPEPTPPAKEETSAAPLKEDSAVAAKPVDMAETLKQVYGQEGTPEPAGGPPTAVADAAPAPAAEPPAMQPLASEAPVTPVKETTPPPAETAAAEPEKKSIILPWLRKDNGQASVEVDEAIRVPLTTAQNDAEQKPTINAVPVPQSNAPSADIKDVQKASASHAANVPGWLNVEYFSSEAQASNFWETVHNSVPSQAAGLRVRIIRPLADSDEPKVKLNIGPFANEDEAMAFCHTGILEQDASLNCAFTETEPEGIARLVPSRGDHSDRYAARRQMLMEERALHRRDESGMEESAGAKQYWLQVASSDNQMDALQAWEKLRTDNADLLDNIRSSVTSPTMGGSTGYVIKIGPMDTNEQAVALCKSLESRGVSCSIFSNM